MNNPEIVAPRQEAHQPISVPKLWYGLLIGPVGWTLALLANYFLVPAACGFHSNLILYLVVAAFAILQIIGVIFSWQSMRQALELRRAGRSVVVHRALFMATAGLIASGYFLAVTLAMLIPITGLNPCSNSIIEGMPTLFIGR